MNPAPNALCFGTGLPAAGAACSVSVTPEGLWIVFTAEKHPDEQIPYDAMAVTAGGFDHDHMVVTWGAGESARTLYLKDPALIIAFRRAAPPELTEHLDRTAQQVRRARRRHRAVWLAGIASVLLLVLFVWFQSGLMVEWAVKQIPVEWEEKIGAVAYRQMLSGQTVVKDGKAVEAVEEITRRLTEPIADNPYTFHVSVVQSDVVNAFALPGGYVVVYTGLMKKARSGEEVAGVLGHELSHVLERHGMERVVKQLGLAAVVTIVFGDQQGLIRLAQDLGLELLTLKFSREQETEADLSGLLLLHQAKIASDGMVGFFERLSGQDKERLELFSTHPMSAARATRLKAEIARLPKRTPEPFRFDWSQVQQSIGHEKATGAQ